MSVGLTINKPSLIPLRQPVNQNILLPTANGGQGGKGRELCYLYAFHALQKVLSHEVITLSATCSAKPWRN